MNTLHAHLSIFGLFLLTHLSFGQDTIWLEKKPEVILKSWYPEFMEWPALKIGESKILFTLIPNFESTVIRDNKIELTSEETAVQIQETDKTNQYICTVGPTTKKFVELIVWFDLESTVVMLKNKGDWVNIDEIYSSEDGGIFLESIRLKIVN